MKVPDNLLFSLFQEQDARIRRELSEKTLEISTGRKHRNISDDPPTTHDLIELKREISQLSQYAKNRLFADTTLSYAELNLGQMEDSLNLLHAKAIQAKNHLLQEDQLRALGELFLQSLRALLDRANDQLGGNYLFGGASLTTKPFDENSLNYVASSESFKVWLSENYRVDVFLRGGETFGVNAVLSSATFSSPNTNFSAGGTLIIRVGNSTLNVPYSTAQTLTDLADYLNANYSNLLRAAVSQNPDGSYSLLVLSKDLDVEISISETGGGDLSPGFYSPNVLQVVRRVGEKLRNALFPEDADLMLLRRSFDRVAYRRSQLGSVLMQVKNLQPTQESLEDTLKKQKSDLEDADLSQSIMEYTRYKMAYEALMRLIADQKDLTILKYLR